MCGDGVGTVGSANDKDRSSYGRYCGTGAIDEAWAVGGTDNAEMGVSLWYGGYGESDGEGVSSSSGAAAECGSCVSAVIKFACDVRETEYGSGKYGSVYVIPVDEGNAFDSSVYDDLSCRGLCGLVEGGAVVYDLFKLFRAGAGAFMYVMVPAELIAFKVLDKKVSFIMPCGEWGIRCGGW